MEKQGFVRDKSYKELTIFGLVISLLCVIFAGGFLIPVGWAFRTGTVIFYLGAILSFLTSPIFGFVLLLRGLSSASFSGFFKATLIFCGSFILVALLLFWLLLNMLPRLHVLGIPLDPLLAILAAYVILFMFLLLFGYIVMSIVAWVVALIITRNHIIKTRKTQENIRA